MEITFEKRNTGTLLMVKGRMDAVSSPEFEVECQKLLDSGEKFLVVDLDQLEYISSAGLRSILASTKKIKSIGGTIKFCGLSGMVEEVFQVSGLASIFTVTATAEEAFSS